MISWEAVKNKVKSMSREQRDICFLSILAVVAITLQALHAPEWVEYTLLGIAGVYIVLSSPKVQDEDNILDKALNKTRKQLSRDKHPKGKVKRGK